MMVKEIKEAKTEDLIFRLAQIFDVEKKWARVEEQRIIKELSKRYGLDEEYMQSRFTNC